MTTTTRAERHATSATRRPKRPRRNPGNRGAGNRPPATTAPHPRHGATPVKVAFVTKFPVEFFTAMEDAAKAYATANEGSRSSTSRASRQRTSTARSPRSRTPSCKGFDAMVITPMGNDVIPALDAAADDGLGDRARRQRPGGLHQEDRCRGDRQRQPAAKLAGEYLKSVLKEGDTIGLMEGVRGVPALDARIQGVKDALEGTGVEVIIGGAETKCDSAQGATVAEDLLTREPDLTAIYSACDDPAIAAATVAKDKGKDIMVVGYDGLPTAAQAILDGDMTATIAQFPGRMAALGRRRCGQRCARKPGRAVHRTGTELVTSENADQFLSSSRSPGPAGCGGTHRRDQPG